MSHKIIHKIQYRLFSPLVQGLFAYLIVLLANHNLGHLTGIFLDEELLVCILLAFVMQESTRVCIWLYEKTSFQHKLGFQTVAVVLSALVVSVLALNVLLYLYYNRAFGFPPDSSELWIFNLVYGFFVMVHLLVYFSQTILEVTEKKEESWEESIRHGSLMDYQMLTRELNPKLLFDCLDAIIATMKYNKGDTERIIQHMSEIYRYVIRGGKLELVPLHEELNASKRMVELFGFLPYRKVQLDMDDFSLESLIAPTAILSEIEKAIRRTIMSDNLVMKIQISEKDNVVSIRYLSEDSVMEDRFEKDPAYFSLPREALMGGLANEEQSDGEFHQILIPLMSSNTVAL